jgi:hypothetical protein
MTFASLFDLKRQLERAKQIQPTDFTHEQAVAALHFLASELENAHRRIDELEKSVRESG